MKPLRVVLLLLRPSLLSFVASLLMSLLILLLFNWSFMIRTPLFYDYFFGPVGLVTVLQNAPSGMAGFWEAVVAGPFTYNILVLIVAALVGFGVYEFLEGFDKVASRASETLNELHEAAPGDDGYVKREISVRLGVRIVSFVLWIVFWVILSKVLLPFSILSFKAGLAEPFTAHGISYNLVGILVLMLGFHIQVILLRFLTLRIRVFGTHPDLYV